MGNVIVTPVILETILNQLLNLICIMIYLMWLPDFFFFFFKCQQTLCGSTVGVDWAMGYMQATSLTAWFCMECGTSELWTNQKHDIHNSTGQVKYN